MNKSERETYYNFSDESPIAQVSTYNLRMIQKMLILKEKYPEEVKIIKHQDEYLEADIPKKWLKIRPPRIYSEEEKEVLRERLEQIRNRKGTIDTEKN